MTSFPIKADIDGKNDLLEVAKYNHTMASFSDSDTYKAHRRKSNWLACDVLYGDIDNTHSEDKNEWMTIGKFKLQFRNYEYYIVTSKSHRKEKDGKPARDKFHVYFPVKPFDSAEQVEVWLKKLTKKYTFFDRQVKDSARFFSASPNATIFYNKGTSIKKDLYDVELGEQKSELLPIKEIDRGNRDDQFYRYACSLRSGGSDAEEIKEFLHQLNDRLEDPLSDWQVEKCIKSALTREGPTEPKKLLKADVIRNYYWKEYTTNSKSGGTTTNYAREPYIDFTPDMEKPKDCFFSFLDGSGKRFLFEAEKPDSFISSSDEFYVACNKNGYVLDFHGGQPITEKKYMTWVKQTLKPFTRFSMLPEIRDNHDTVFTHGSIEPQNNGWFRKMLNILTVDSEKDRYRFAAGLLSAFMDSRFDARKPLFSVIAQTKSSGKTTAVESLINIIQGEGPLKFTGDKDEKQVSGVKALSNKFVLYDNLQNTSRQQMLSITRNITSETIPAWFMNISHSHVKNNKVFWATFNDDNSFNDDIIERILTIKMKPSGQISDEERMDISKKLQVFRKNRKKVLADILYILQGNETKESHFKPPTKFGLWAEKIVEYLSIVFPEIDEFDLSLSDEDRELSQESTMMKEFIESLFENATDDTMFKTNQQVVDAYRTFYSSPSATMNSITRKILNNIMSISQFSAEKNSKHIPSVGTKRGFIFKRIT